GVVQGNVVVLPADDAGDFLRFCQRNPKPCPLLAVSEPGDPALPQLGEDIDIRTDVPQYRIFEHGEPVGDLPEVRDLWRDDLVAFVLGCSFSFEEPLIQAGIRLRYLEAGREVAMYRTWIPTRPAGRFHGPMVVSMRSLTPKDAIRAIQITSRFPQVHGAPVHFGDPKAIGIDDLERPDYGEHTPFPADEVPVFWACGVTPQAVVQTVRPAFCITHKPGHMLVTDLLNAELAAL
ncbi:MAG: putative hydro-lyase, partial [Geminicoccales bacterium]